MIMNKNLFRSNTHICAFSHATSIPYENELNGINDEKDEDMEKAFDAIKNETADKVKYLKSEIELSKKEFSEYVREANKERSIIKNDLKQQKEKTNKIETDLRKDQN